MALPLPGKVQDTVSFAQRTEAKEIENEFLGLSCHIRWAL